MHWSYLMKNVYIFKPYCSKNVRYIFIVIESSYINEHTVYNGYISIWKWIIQNHYCNTSYTKKNMWVCTYTELIIHISNHKHLKNFLIVGSEMYNIKTVE